MQFEIRGNPFFYISEKIPFEIIQSSSHPAVLSALPVTIRLDKLKFLLTDGNIRFILDFNIKPGKKNLDKSGDSIGNPTIYKGKTPATI